MSAAITVRITSNRWKAVEEGARKAMEATIEQLAWAVSDEIQDEVTREGLIRTGKYLNSWTVERPFVSSSRDGASRLVKSKGAPYGAYLEYGHRAIPGQVFPLIEGNTVKGFRRVKVKWVPPRPHVRPVVERYKRGKAAQQYGSIYASYWRKFQSPAT